MAEDKKNGKAGVSGGKSGAAGEPSGEHDPSKGVQSGSDANGVANAVGFDATSSAGKTPVEKAWVGFDLGGTKMLASVYDRNFKQLGRVRKKTKGAEGEKFVINRIINCIHAALEAAEISVGDLAGIGIGCPGPIDIKRGVVIEAPNLGWGSVNIRKILGDEFNTEVAVCNDVDAGIYGEYKFGAARKSDCAIGIFPGTGIGGGCVFDGKIFQSKRRSCMEIGHIPICSDTVMDGGGNHGTLESVASRLAIASSLAVASYRGQTPALNKRAGTDLAGIRSSAIAESLQEDGGIVRKILEQACDHLASAMVTVIHLMAPDVIVLGGGLVEEMPELFLDHTRKQVAKRILKSFEGTYEVKVAELGDDAAVLGAAAWIRELTTKSNG